MLSLICLIVFGFLSSFNADMEIHLSDSKLMQHPHYIPKSRIINGDEVEPHSAPFMVLILLPEDDLCGGSLISPNYVMTAAHCLYDYSSAKVILGAHNRTTKESSQRQFQVTSSDFTFHYLYSSWHPVDYDIALINLPESVTENEYIKIVKLPKFSEMHSVYTGEDVIVYGWGQTKDSGATQEPASDVLRSATQRMISRKECRESDPQVSRYVTKYHICTSYCYESEAICGGDSGSPLVYDGVQIGIASFGADKCESFEPSVYTSVNIFLRWLEIYSDALIDE